MGFEIEAIVVLRVFDEIVVGCECFRVLSKLMQAVDIPKSIFLLLFLQPFELIMIGTFLQYGNSLDFGCSFLLRVRYYRSGNETYARPRVRGLLHGPPAG